MLQMVTIDEGYLTAVKLGAAAAVIGVGILKVVNKLMTTGIKQKTKTPEEEELEKELILEDLKPSHLWNTVMFFPDHNAGNPDSTAQQFLWYFAQARVSIQVCIYNFSLPELEYVIVEQFKRGLLVQFVVGRPQTANKLREKDIPCGTIPRNEGTPDTDQIMHHKFAIIDEQAILTGSLNWTTESIVRNKENVVVTTNPKIVLQYMEEFWKLKSKSERARQFY